MFVCFNDMIIEVAKNVEIAPDSIGGNAGKRYMRHRWQELYDSHFLPSQKLLNFSPTCYNKFTAIRKEYRKNYQKHKKIR